MSIPNKRERKVRPTHPGEMLREDFLPDYGLTVSSFAKALGVSRQTVNAIENGKYDPSLPLAFSIARTFNRHIEEIFVSEEKAPAGRLAPTRAGL